MIYGRWQWTSAASATTNDRGEYRMDSLLPGTYLVVVACTQTTTPGAVSPSAAATNAEAQIQLMRAGVLPGTSSRAVGDWQWTAGGRSALTVPNPTEDGRVSVYPTVFYPSARSARIAETIALESGQERTGVDVQLRLIPATTVSGVAVGPEGPLAGTANSSRAGLCRGSGR
jgi:hypothetical protein